MKFVYPAVIGTCIAVIASAVGLESFSGAWWAFTFATNTLVTFFGLIMKAPATP